ncbi:MAG: cytochrome b [Alphaproteobacteria bacterium]|nr:cytochrome b [Alphaproteobacteria bacterium]
MAVEQLHYGTVAKLFHWVIVALLTVQLPLGWLMPDIHRDMQPGQAMSLHISIGLTVLILIVVRFGWRLTHPVAPESNLPGWQRISSELVHWLLYLVVFLTTMTGWIFASMRGWSLSLFGIIPLPGLVGQGSQFGRAVGGYHHSLPWVLVGLIALHVAAALVHLFYYRDGVMRRMLPQVLR